MTKEQELEKLRNDLAEAKRKARQYENRVKGVQLKFLGKVT